MDLIRLIEEEQLRQDVPDFSPGDTVRVHITLQEGGRERTQVFQGIVIGRKGKGISETFTVRRVTHGVGVERVFLLNSPRIDEIELVKRGKVRRSKLYYLRDRIGRAAQVEERR